MCSDAVLRLEEHQPLVGPAARDRRGEVGGHGVGAESRCAPGPFSLTSALSASPLGQRRSPVRLPNLLERRGFVVPAGRDREVGCAGCGPGEMSAHFREPNSLTRANWTLPLRANVSGTLRRVQRCPPGGPGRGRGRGWALAEMSYARYRSKSNCRTGTEHPRNILGTFLESSGEFTDIVAHHSSFPNTPADGYSCGVDQDGGAR